MSDITSRLEAVKHHLAELARLAGAEQAAAAHKLAAEMTFELDQAIAALKAPPDESSPAQPAKLPAPHDEVEKCPRCMLRSFTFQKGTVRESEEPGVFEALYRCTSCGHEGRHEIR